MKKKPELVIKIQKPPMLTTLSMLLKQYSAGVDDDSYGEVFFECKEILQSTKDEYLSLHQKLCVFESPKWFYSKYISVSFYEI